jgi:phage host-nuclease inhibitor protein Gam
VTIPDLDTPDTDDEPVVDMPASEVEALLVADYQLDKIGALQQRLATIRAIAASKRASLNDWLAAETSRVQAEIDWRTQPLLDLHRRLMERDPKRLTIRLPNGVLSSRKTRPEVHVNDPDEFVLWAEQAGRKDLLRTVTTTQVDTNALRAATVENGEKLPGVIVIPADRQYKAKPATTVTVTARDDGDSDG